MVFKDSIFHVSEVEGNLFGISPVLVMVKYGSQTSVLPSPVTIQPLFGNLVSVF